MLEPLTEPLTKFLTFNISVLLLSSNTFFLSGYNDEVLCLGIPISIHWQFDLSSLGLVCCLI